MDLSFHLLKAAVITTPIPVTIESFEELAQEWDEDFLPDISRRAKLTPTVGERFCLHFSRENLHKFFRIEVTEIRENHTFEHILETCLALDSSAIETHKKNRRNYLKAFRIMCASIPTTRGAAKYLLKWLLGEWTEYCHKREIQKFGESPRQTLAGLLTSLDYCSQKRVFEDIQLHCLDQRRRASAFVLQADPELHRWLVCSLLQSVDELSNSTIISAHGGQLFKGLNQFWTSLGMNLQPSGGLSSKSVVIDALCQRIETQSIVMVVNQVDRARGRLLDFRDEFWLPLVEQLSQPERQGGIEGCFKLIMISPTGATPFSDYDWTTYLAKRDLPDVEDDEIWQCPVELAALTQISCSDVEKWLRRASVQDFLQRRVGVDAIATYRKTIKSIPDRDSNPYTVLHEICCEFNFENGLESLDAVWTSFPEVAA